MRWDSSKIDLGALRVRAELLPYAEFEYPTTTRIALDSPRSQPELPRDFLRTRRSRRGFGRIGVDELGPLLWHAARTCGYVEGEYGTVELRPAPSAGARHPIDLMLFDTRVAQGFVYRSTLHCLDQLRVGAQEHGRLVAAARAVLDLGEGWLLWLVAQPARTLAKYECGEGFVLLDAGALVATLSFAAHATDVAYCALGISGEPWISRLLDSQGAAVGVLGGLVGTHPSEQGP